MVARLVVFFMLLANLDLSAASLVQTAAERYAQRYGGRLSDQTLLAIIDSLRLGCWIAGAVTLLWRRRSSCSEV
jgi:hypothetical protein